MSFRFNTNFVDVSDDGGGGDILENITFLSLADSCSII